MSNMAGGGVAFQGSGGDLASHVTYTPRVALTFALIEFQLRSSLLSLPNHQANNNAITISSPAVFTTGPTALRHLQ
jgi:hypothetical protein